MTMKLASENRRRESAVGTNAAPFDERHIGPSDGDVRAMLAKIGLPSIRALISETVPVGIVFGRSLDLPPPAGERDALSELAGMMARNKPLKSFIGQGYYGCHVPAVIQRNLFENPAWYTAYVPYQAEISQGRLELLFHFQTLVAELTGLPVASASLLDEATAVAEAVGVAFRHHRGNRRGVVIAGDLHPQCRDVLETRGDPLGVFFTDGPDEQTAAVIIPWPDTYGVYGDHAALIETAKQCGALIIAVADPLALALLEQPACWGADIAVGSMQRFGVPLGYGGPHAAYMAVCESLARLTPGRLVGESIDAQGRPAYRLALQTREQHIRRDKATSNICTAQALLANMAAAYAVWHGPEGLQALAAEVHARARRFRSILNAAGVATNDGRFFDTVSVTAAGKAQSIAEAAEQSGRLLRVLDSGRVAVSFDETSSEDDLEALAALFKAKPRAEVPLKAEDTSDYLPARRTQPFLTQAVFHQYRSETELMRYLRRLADKDLALDRAMIPLGSCTMKLNAAAEIMPVSWPGVADLHPFAPDHCATGYRRMIKQLESWLAEITGFDAVSLQPNAGSQGELAGLLAVRRYFKARGEEGRKVCLIPASAHGTNPASAHMAGFDVIVVRCTDEGDVDLADLEAKAEQHADRLAVLMITYPSTHGVFEEGISDICRIIHDHGGQVYFDGANLNALVGLARPGDIGADVCHLNLHKTFCIPHGGGGPGVGPVGVKAHLIPYLPGHVAEGSGHAVSAAPFGSASILPITWMYIRMMGAAGLKRATETAILNANYVAARLNAVYPILYAGKNGRVAHECIIDPRTLKERAGVTVDDIAKRLIDYGFHAPTMSWPVAGTLMVEPTESESKQEIDRFCDAMIAIAGEADKVSAGHWPRDNNPLVNAPHTAADLMDEAWRHPYSRQMAVQPAGVSAASKYWPPVSRIDNVYGDRNLVCSCPPLNIYEREAG